MSKRESIERTLEDIQKEFDEKGKEIAEREGQIKQLEKELNRQEAELEEKEKSIKEQRISVKEIEEKAGKIKNEIFIEADFPRLVKIELQNHLGEKQREILGEIEETKIELQEVNTKEQHLITKANPLSEDEKLKQGEILRSQRNNLEKQATELETKLKAIDEVKKLSLDDLVAMGNGGRTNAQLSLILSVRDAIEIMERVSTKVREGRNKQNELTNLNSEREEIQEKIKLLGKDIDNQRDNIDSVTKEKESLEHTNKQDIASLEELQKEYQDLSKQQVKSKKNNIDQNEQKFQNPTNTDNSKKIGDLTGKIKELEKINKILNYNAEQSETSHKIEVELLKENIKILRKETETLKDNLENALEATRKRESLNSLDINKVPLEDELRPLLQEQIDDQQRKITELQQAVDKSEEQENKLEAELALKEITEKAIGIVNNSTLDKERKQQQEELAELKGEVTTLEQQLNNEQTKNQKLIRKAEEDNNTVQKTQEELQEKTKEITHLKVSHTAEIEQFKAENKRLAEKLTEQNAEIKKSKESIETLHKERTEFERELAVVNTNLDTEKNAANINFKELEGANRKAEEIQKKLIETETEANELTKKLEKVTQEAQITQEKLEKNTEHLEVANNKLTALQNRQEEINLANENLNKEKQELQKQLKAQLTENNGLKDELVKKIDSKDTKIKKLEGDTKTLQVEQATLRQELDKKELEIEQLGMQNEESTKQLEVAKKAQAQLEVELVLSNEEKNTAEIRIEDLIKEVEKTREGLETKAQEITNLRDTYRIEADKDKGKIKELAEELTTQRAKVKELEATKNEAIKERLELQEKLALADKTSAEEKQQLKTQLKEQVRNIEILNTQLTEAQITREELALANASLTQREQEFNKELESKNNEIIILKENTEIAETKINNLTKRTEEAEQAQVTLRKEIAELGGRLVEKDTKIEESNTQLEAKDNRIKKLETDVQNARETQTKLQEESDRVSNNLKKGNTKLIELQLEKDKLVKQLDVDAQELHEKEIEFQEKTKELQRQLETIQQAQKESKIEIEKLVSEKEKLQNTLTVQSKDTLRKMEGLLLENNKLTKELKVQINKTEEAEKKSREELQLENQINDLTEQSKAVIVKNRELNTQLEEVRKTQVASQKKVLELEGQLAEKGTEFNTLNGKLNDKEIENDRLNKQLNEQLAIYEAKSNDFKLAQDRHKKELRERDEQIENQEQKISSQAKEILSLKERQEEIDILDSGEPTVNELVKARTSREPKTMTTVKTNNPLRIPNTNSPIGQITLEKLNEMIENVKLGAKFANGLQDQEQNEQKSNQTNTQRKENPQNLQQSSLSPPSTRALGNPQEASHTQNQKGTREVLYNTNPEQEAEILRRLRELKEVQRDIKGANTNRSLTDEIVKDNNKLMAEFERESYKTILEKHSFASIEWHNNPGSSTENIKIPHSDQIIESTTVSKPQSFNFRGQQKTIEKFRNIDLKSEIKSGKDLTMMFTVKDLNGNNIGQNDAAYLAVHYGKDGKLKEVVCPEPVIYTGIEPDSPICIERNGQLYTLPVNKGKLEELQQVVSKHRRLEEKLNDIKKGLKQSDSKTQPKSRNWVATTYPNGRDSISNVVIKK